MRQRAARERLAVQGRALDIRSPPPRALGDDRERAPIRQMDRDAREERRPDRVLLLSRRDRIQAERRHHVPRAHLTTVLVAGEAVVTGRVQTVEDTPHHGLRLPRLTGVIVQVRDVVTRFVAMRVLSDEPGDVGLLTPRGTRRDREQRVELRGVTRTPAQRLDVTGDVLRYEEAVLPAVRLGEVEVHLGRVERRLESSVDARPHEARRRIEQMPPALRALEVAIPNDGLPECLRQPRDAPVVIRVLERLRHALALALARHIAAHAVVREPTRIGFGARAHRGECRGRIEATDALGPRVGDHRHGVVPDHAIGLVAGEFPDRQPATLAILREERLDEVARALGLEDRVQRVRGTERVPQREHGVLRPTLGDMHLAVATAIAAIHIGVQVRLQHRVVERGVEGRVLRGRGSCHLDARQGAPPRRTRPRADGLEVPALRFGIERRTRTGHVHRRDPDLGDDARPACGIEEQGDAHIASLGLTCSGQRDAAHDHACPEGLREPRHEEHALVACPRA